MKINIDIQPLLHQKTGIGQYIFHFLQGLQKIDHENHYILTCFSFKRENVSFPLHNTNFQINRKCLLPGRILEKFWKTFNRPWYDSLSGEADIFHFPNFIIHPVKKGRTIATIHDLSFKRFPQYTEPGNLVYLRKCIDRTLKRADHIIADSQATKTQIIEDYRYPREKITVVYLGVADYFHPVVDQNILSSIRRKYGLPDRYIFYLGTIEPRKNLKTLFNAYSEIKKNSQFSNIKLVLSGMKGWLLEQIFEPLKQYNIESDVLFTNYVPDEDLPALYSMAEFFVFPSLYEGFGLPPLEAMACGVPVISSSAPSLPEVLGDGAVFFEPESSDELTNKMLTVLTNSDKRQEMVKNGSKQAKKYTWQKAAEEILNIYKNIFSV